MISQQETSDFSAPPIWRSPRLPDGYHTKYIPVHKLQRILTRSREMCAFQFPTCASHRMSPSRCRVESAPNFARMPRLQAVQALSRAHSRDPGHGSHRDTLHGAQIHHGTPGHHRGIHLVHDRGSCPAGWYALERPVKHRALVSFSRSMASIMRSTFRFRPRKTLSFKTRA